MGYRELSELVLAKDICDGAIVLASRVGTALVVGPHFCIVIS